MNGFWTAKFSTPMGAGGGVAYFTANEVFGGDSGVTYLGTYQVNGTEIVAKLKITPHLAGVPSVFGSISQAFDLTITGTIQGTQMSGKGTASIAPGVNFQVNLTKVK
jgi:T3SS negative regulator,GrlR